MFAKIYDLLMSDIEYNDILIWLKPYIKKDDLILDAGCGSGYFLKELLLDGYVAIGIDHDDEMLSIAHERLTSNHLKSQLYHHDLRDPLHANVDTIVSFFDVMNYFRGIKGVFQNIKRALSENGKFIFDVYKYEVLEEYDGYVENETDPIEYIWKIHRNQDKLIHQVLIDEKLHEVNQYVKPLSYYTDVLKSVGFKHIEVLDGPDVRKHYIIATL